MEEANNCSVLRVETGYIRSLEAVAVNTRECKVLDFGSSAMLASDDVVYLKWGWMEG
jgi:hypothetical protein